MPAAAGCSPARWACSYVSAAAPGQDCWRASARPILVWQPGGAPALYRDDEAEARRLTGVKDPNSISSPRARLACLLLVLVAAGAAACRAAAPAARAEAEALLLRMQASGCEFQRNGSWYSGAEARAHLLKKLDYLDSRALITTTEQFIAQGASASNAMSGQPYAGSLRGRSRPWRAALAHGRVAAAQAAGWRRRIRKPQPSSPRASKLAVVGSRRPAAALTPVDQRKVREGDSGRLEADRGAAACGDKAETALGRAWSRRSGHCGVETAA